MGLKRRITGGILSIIGFMLSPLSWWNDAFVNLPLALAFAWLVSSLCASAWREFAFEVAVVVGYWLTNVLGFVLMHRGLRHALGKESQSAVRSEWKKDVLVSLAYTTVIVLLIKFGVLKPIQAYFPNG